MGKEPWEMGIGAVTEKPQDGDSLLAQAKSDRERKRLERAMELEEAEFATKKAKLEKEKASAEAAVEKTAEQSEGVRGFQVVGKIDVNEERDRALAEATSLRKELADSANRTAEENAKLRDKLPEAEMREIKAINEAAIKALTEKIDNRPLAQQLEEIRSTASELGLKAPDPTISDPALSIQMLQLQHEEAQRMRQWEWEKIKHQEEMEERREQRRAEAAFRQQQLAQEEKKMEFWNNAPKYLAEIAVEGMKAGSGNEPPIDTKRTLQEEYILTVPQGEAGSTRCPNCQSEVGVGPTARVAVCAKCDTQIAIKRVNPKNSKVHSSVTETDSEEEE